MTVYLVGAGPGDPGLLTLRGAELLAAADVVVYDRLVDPSLLLLAPRAAELVDVGKVPGAGRTAEGAGRQEEINRLLVERGRRGAAVVRLKGGDPFLFGRGGEEAEALDAAGVPWEVVPGVSSAFAAPAAAGVPVTHRGLATSATVVTGHVGDPTAPGGVDWASLGRAGGTLVVLMGMARRAEIAERLIDAGRPASTPVLVVEWGTTPDQRIERTTLGGLEGVSLGSPAVIVVGDVAALDLGRRRGPLSNRSVVVTRPRVRPAGEAAGVAPGGGDGDRLVAALRVAGARVLSVPAIEITGPEDGGAALARALDGLADYRWMVVTSQQAVSRVFEHLRDVRVLGGVKVAAVGHATAASLAAHGVVADLVPVHQSAEGVADAFPAAPADGARVLFPAADGARPGLPSGLRAKGWSVDEVVAYRTVPATPPPDAVVPRLETADAITFSSPSAVHAYLAMRTSSGERLPVPPVVVAVGAVTAAAARDAGLDVALEAPVGRTDGLVEGLASRLDARGS